MAITFDPVNKIITLDSFNVSSEQIWSRWIDWYASSDNFKYLPAFSELGGVAPVALYLFLENGWRIRPQESDGLTTVTGNLLVQGGGNAFVPTVGNYASQVFLETPLSAQAISVSSGSGLDAAQDAKLTQVYALLNAIENGKNHAQIMRILLAAMAGKVAGAETPVITFRNNADTKNRIIASVDGKGNRSSVTLDDS